jgi:hypothetical protein
MTAPYDHDALWLKAKLFLKHAMDREEPRTFEERALWASLALELLAKAALSRLSPLLIATPQEDGTNLLIAAGAIAGDARFRSIPAHTLFGRCHKAFKPFNDREALQIAQARNEYLHGAGVGFEGLPEDAWWARFWARTAILVDHLDNDLDGLVGRDRVAVVETYLSLNTRNLESRLESLLEHARQRLSLRSSANPPAWIEREFARPKDLSAGLAHFVEARCPACGTQGQLEGSEVSSYDVKVEQVGEEDYDQWVELTVDSDYFSCSNCRLVLDGYELIDTAGLPSTFGAVGDDSDYAEDEYGND